MPRDDCAGRRHSAAQANRGRKKRKIGNVSVRIAMASRPCITGNQPSRASGVFYCGSVFVIFSFFSRIVVFFCVVSFDEASVQSRGYLVCLPIGSWPCRAVACLDRPSFVHAMLAAPINNITRDMREGSRVSFGPRDIARERRREKTNLFSGVWRGTITPRCRFANACEVNLIRQQPHTCTRTSIGRHHKP